MLSSGDSFEGRITVTPDEILRTIEAPLVGLTTEAKDALLETMTEYREAVVRVIDVGWQLETCSSHDLHHLTYRQIRTQSPLPAQLVISARNKAHAVISGIRNLDGKRRSRRRHARESRKPQMVSLIPIRYDQRSAKLYLQTREVSLSTTNGRIRAHFSVPAYFEKYLEDGWHPRNFELMFRKQRDKFVLLLVMRYLPEEQMEGVPCYVGVDRGMKRLAVTSTGRFFSGKRLRNTQRKRFRLVRELQSKGTRSARRKLRLVAGRVRRFQKDVNHRISKEIVASVPSGGTIILEDLSGIRLSTSQKARGRRILQRELNWWPFYELERFIEYKAQSKGIRVMRVDPAFSSQMCSRCGHVGSTNRKGSWFHCASCGYQCNVDLNASRNLVHHHFVEQLSFRELTLEAIRVLGGCPVSVPNVLPR